MPGYSLAKAEAKGLVNEKEIRRFAIIYLAMAEEIKPSTQTMEHAAKEAGNTINSFKVMLGNTMKKIRGSECSFDAAGDNDNTTPPPTPTQAPKKGAPKKRKGDGDDGGISSLEKARSGKKRTKINAAKTKEVMEAVQKAATAVQSDGHS